VDADRHALLTEQVHDNKDQALVQLLTEHGAAEVVREVHELMDVENALQRLQHGSFGACVDCSATIPAERLEAYPTAKRCFSCQDLHERAKPG
jgi:RNA polymerase-binding transcription factor DksA